MNKAARYAGMALMLAGGAAISIQAAAQAYPTRPVRIIVPYPAGIGFDVLVRAMAQDMSKSVGQPVLVENRPGVSTIVGAEACAKAAPDGYTTCVVSRDTLSFNPALRPNLPYDPVRDFDLVAPLVFQTSVLAINAAVPANSVQDLISLARAKPGALNYGSIGPGSVTHMFLEVLKMKNGLNIVHVPFNGPAPLVNALVGNQVQITYFSAASTVGQIKGGKLRALAVSGNKRSPLLPDVPAVSELGIADIDDRVWYAMLMPVGSPKDAAARLNAEVGKLYTNAVFRDERLIGQGWEPISDTVEQFQKFIIADRKIGAEMVKISGAKVE
jgi:tripartite-type tricarboxylate transporter receptor subunit TctC